ncbi:glycosyltransferase [Aquabacter sp. L1I39]|uniref:glycosyltransferase family 2 protein n=1 Tax=Aquabacter sp. L1I39 TaxID=2820278 RepID=UPI001ADC712B|nr:glycosyltransferase family 2 protein [Aquabacter sp. L1I39]QTL04946.1 glycosyltransferase [Aquabacter sp. L1I39]
MSLSSAALMAGFTRAHVLAEPLQLPPSREAAAHVPFLFWLAGQLLPRHSVDLTSPSTGCGVAVGQALTVLSEPGSVLLASPVAVDLPLPIAGRLQVLREPLEQTAETPAPGGVDLLILDSASDASAFELFEAWRSRLSDRAAVVLVGTRLATAEGEVARLFLTLSASLPSFELPDGGGLGLVQMGAHMPRELASLLSMPGAPADEDLVQQVRTFCGRISAPWWEAARGQSPGRDAGAPDALSDRLEALAEELERERRAGAAVARELEDAVAATSERQAQHISELIERLTNADRDLSGALEKLRAAAPQAARAELLEQDLATERLRAAAQAREHAAAIAELERQHAAYSGALADHAAATRADLSVERLRAQRLSEQLSGAERRLNRLREDIAEQARRLEAVALDVEMERARRRALATFIAGRYVSARRGLRGLIGRLLRRFGPGDLAYRCRALSDSGLFDRDFYVREYPDAGGRRVEPVVDFLIRGGFEGCRPNPVFDSAFYLNSYPDVRSAGVNPLWHYALYGEAEGRLPSQLFDPKAYRAAHPELPPDQSALAHYLASHFPAASCETSRRTLGARLRRALRFPGRGLGHRTRLLRPVAPAPVGGRADARFIAFRPSPDRPGGDQLTAVEAGTYEWVAQGPGYTYLAPRRPSDLDEQIAALRSAPVFSILVPLYNTPPALLKAMIRSVQTQWYPHWELILVDDLSPDPQVRATLSQIQDPRVTVHFADRNQGISGATNQALAMAQGDYVVFLDHDDELTEDCLYELALCIDREGADFIYSDEDKISTDGRLVDPFFKPDWSPDMLMSLMYTCHVSCVRRTLAVEVGGLRAEFDGSQDWDFVLRVTERTSRIAHVPKVLYHWRMIPGSAAHTFDAKPQALDAAVRLRLEALKRRGLEGECEAVEGLPAYQRMRYHVAGNPKVSIIIPSKNNGDTLRNCVTSIQERSTYRNVELVIVDNGSSLPDTLSYLEGLANGGSQVIRHDKPFNFSELCNVGARAATGDFLLFLNDDTEVLSADWLERMLGYAHLRHVGAVGAKLLYPQSLRVQHAGVICIADGPSHAFLGAQESDPCYYARNMLESNWLAVTGACLLVERSKFDQVSGFDESFPVAYNDVDLCYRLVEAGYFNVVCPAAQLLHYESMSRGLDHQSSEKMARLRADKRRLDARHPRFFMNDPFFSPNLHPNDVMFSIPG